MDANKVYLEIQGLNEELSQKIKNLKNNLEKLFNGLKETTSCKEIPILLSGLTLLKRNFNNLLGHVNNSAKDELAVVRHKYQCLQREWDNQQEHLGRLQGEVFRLRNQLQNQSAFCASLGAVLGNLVWKASRLQPVVELFLTTQKLSEFFCVVSGTLISFMDTYSRDMPEIKSDETQFILAMCGIVANVAAVPEGRQFIVADDSGKELVENILRFMPLIPPISGDPLKRILLMVLYNISINEAGLVLLQDQKTLLLSLSRVIVCDRVPELKLLALRLLESITFEFATINVLHLHKQFVPMEKLVSIMDGGDAEMRQYAKGILCNIEKAETHFGIHKTKMASAYIPYGECGITKKTLQQ